MTQKILHKRSSAVGRVPTMADLDIGELAVNAYDGKVYLKNTAGGIVEVGAGIGNERGGTAWLNSTAYLMGDIISYSDVAYVSLIGNTNSQPDTNPVEWAKIGSDDEQGGIAYDIAANYIVGDTVTEAGSIYIAVVNNVGTAPAVTPTSWKKVAGTTAWDSGTAYNPGDIVEGSDGNNYTLPEGVADPGTQPPGAPWTPVTSDVERGGVSWSLQYNYVIGDIVSESGLTYVAITNSKGQQPSISIVDWKIASSETTNVSHDPTLGYNEGDLVNVGDNIYVAPAPGIPGSVGIPGPVPPATPWVLTTPDEQGGVVYDPLVQYKAGDIVSYNDVIYIVGATPPAIGTLPTAPLFSDTKPVEPEVGGRIWDTTVTYAIGDIVSNTTIPKLVFISLTATNQGNTLPANGINTDWQELNTVMYNAGVYTPVLGTEYPTTTSESIGASWYVSGLGEGVEYTITTGTLIGTNLADGDKMTWVDGASGSEIWLHSAYPRIKAEIGGVAWKMATAYDVGDVVVDSDIAYNCNFLHTSDAVGDITTFPPSAATATSWTRIGKPEVGGIEYDVTVQYEIGDIVTIDGLIYVIGEDPTNVGNPPPAGTLPGDPEWSASSGERGGLVYDPLVQYQIGDVVTIGGIIYVIGEDPSNPGDPMVIGDDPSDPLDNTTSIPVEPERGGILWLTTTDYVIGDIVSLGGDIYTALTDHTGTSPDASATDWKKFVGHDAYDSTATYNEDDTVTEGGIDYTLLPGDVDSGTPPGNGWTPITTDVERGGVDWDTDYYYVKGDIISEGSATYVAIGNSQGKQPSVSHAPEVWKRITGSALWDAAPTYNEGDIVEGSDGDDYILPEGATPSTGDDPTLGAPWDKITTSTERGGVSWNSTYNYTVGDIVTKAGITYSALIGTINSEPSANPVNWQAIAGTDVYDDTASYDDGDTLNEGGDDYIIPPGAGPTAVPAPVPPAAPWVRVTLDKERGGVAWDVDYYYVIGDIVTLGGERYTATLNNTNKDPSVAANIGTWQREVISVVHDDKVTYVEGDLVTVGDQLYIAPVAGVAAGTFDPLDWDRVNPETGGVAWTTATDYLVGDVVTISSNSYIATALHTSTAIDDPDGDPTKPNGTRWTQVDSGGSIFSDKNTYEVGDLVTHEVIAAEGVKVYRCTTIPTPNPGAFDIADWALTDTSGSAYDATATYAIGDIVVNDLVIPNQVFVSLTVANKGNALPANGTNTNWQELDSVFYNAMTGGDANGDGVYVALDDGSVNGGMMHCPWDSNNPTLETGPDYLVPNTLGEYPATDGAGSGTAEVKGAIWYVTGLGYDVNGDSNTYTMFGGNLAGGKIRNGDRLTWADGVQGSEIWLLSPVPTVAGERGGLLWRSGTNYSEGDIVSDTGVTYTALTPVTGSAPSAAVAGEWKVTVEDYTEKRGVAWAVTTDYVVGDTVSEGDLLWICNVVHTSLTGDVVLGSPTQLAQTSWDIAAAPEKGGVIWGLGVDYLIGDVISDGGLLWVALADHTSLTGDDPLGAPNQPLQTSWAIAAAPERGGVAWVDLTEYIVGDIVVDTTTDFVDTYRCVASHTAASTVPSGDTTNWRRVNTSAVETPSLASAYTPNLHNKDIFEYTLDQDTMINVPLNGQKGDTGQIIIRQDGTGFHACSWDSAWDFMGAAPDMAVDPDAVNIFEYTVIDGLSGTEDIKVEFTMSTSSAPAAIFEFTVNATDTVLLPITGGPYYIDWGNGTVTSGSGSTGMAYIDAGVYNVSIKGSVDTFNFRDNPGGKDLLTAVFQLGLAGWTSLDGAFTNCTNLNRFIHGDATASDTSAVTSMAQMFDGCTNLTTLDISGMNTSAVTSMNSMFRNIPATYIDVSGFDTTLVTDLGSMFLNTKTTTIDVSGFETSGVTDMSWMFNNTKASTLDINDFDTLSCTTFEGMFKDSKATSLDLDNASPLWDTTAAAGPAFKEMFMNSRATNLDTSNFNTAGATDLSFMFFGCVDTGTADITWDTPLVTSMESMFESSAFGTINASTLETDACTTVSAMFKNSKATALTVPSGYGVCTDMSWMLAGCSETVLGGTITTTACTTMEGMFSNAALTTNPSGAFVTTGVNNMSRMFENTKFDVGANLDTAAVTDMSYMFAGSTTNPLDCTSIGTNACTNMDGMFQNTTIGATAISGWPIATLTTAVDFLNGSTMTTAEYDATLIAWEGQTEQAGVTIDFGDSTYTETAGVGLGNTARNALIANGWTITDGGIA